MTMQLQTSPDPDFSPSIPQKPDSEPSSKPATEPLMPETPSDDELPAPAIFPTA